MKPSSFVVGLLCVGLLSCSAKTDQAGTLPAAAQPAAEQSGTEEQKHSLPQAEIPLITVSASGEEQVTKMPAVDYRKHLNKIFPAVETAVLPAARQTANSNPWGLRTVVVGVGLKLGLGGSVIGWGANAGIRLAFSNSAKPSVP